MNSILFPNVKLKYLENTFILNLMMTVSNHRFQNIVLQVSIKICLSVSRYFMSCFAVAVVIYIP